MSDHIERSCIVCGSLLHHQDDCYKRRYYIQQNDCMSVFPPCVFCGAQYEAHETIDQFGGRGHTIDNPSMPQHGQFHYFTPLPPERSKMRNRDAYHRTPEDAILERETINDSKWQDDLFTILERLKSTSPQSKKHSVSVTVKVADHVEVSYSVSIVQGDV